MFIVYGPGFTEPVRYPELLFKNEKVRQTDPSRPVQAIDTRHRETYGFSPHKRKPASAASRNYKESMQSLQSGPILKAMQMMSSPVISIASGSSVKDAFHAFEERGFRHLPIVSPDGELIGIISDKDMLHCTCNAGVSCQQRQNQSIDTLMANRVLSASIDTDARHIARLFVEKRIGALPIVDENHLVGMVTRSDVLRAVMHSLNLDLWD